MIVFHLCHFPSLKELRVHQDHLESYLTHQENLLIFLKTTFPFLKIGFFPDFSKVQGFQILFLLTQVVFASTHSQRNPLKSLSSAFDSFNLSCNDLSVININ